MRDHITVTLSQEDIAWAVQRAQETLARWGKVYGHYNNKFNSHLKGRLGEVAVEKLIQQWELKHASHFRDADLDKWCDIELQKTISITPCRVDVKTWSEEHWQDLGRCIAVNQVPSLEKKADRIIWCVVEKMETPSPETVLALESIDVDVVGWSTLAEVKGAPIKFTGHAWMRKVENHQLDVDALHPIGTFVESM